MFGIYVRNFIAGQGRYVPDDDAPKIKKEKKDRFREGKKLFHCYCNPGSCNPNRGCYYTNEKYWSNEDNCYLTLDQFLFGKKE